MTSVYSGYSRRRGAFGSISGNYRVQATDTGLIVLVAGVLQHTFNIQKIHIEVTTLKASELWTFQDGAGVPIAAPVSAAAIAHVDLDFGPNGVACAEATSFVLNITGATGAIGWITWEAFKKFTSV